MGGIAESRHGQFTHYYLSNYQKTLVDNIFDDYPFFPYINGNSERP